MFMKKLFRPVVPAPSPDLETIAASPLNDPAMVAAVLDGCPATADAFRERYFSLPEDARPSLTPYFNADFYRNSNPDVVRAGVDPYLHFLLHGLAEERAPHPLIDLAFIKSQLASAGETASLDARCLADALRGNRVQPHPLFDVRFYLDRYADVRTTGTPALQHYIQHGADEGRTPNESFDPDEYVRTHGPLPAGRYGAFLHYVRSGAAAEQGIATGSVGQIHGVLDPVDGEFAIGWAFDSVHPERRLMVEVMEGDRVVARGIADRLREDLRRQAIGDGRCSFQLQVSAELLDGNAHVLTARIAGSHEALHGSRVLVAAKGERACDLLPAAETRVCATQTATPWKNQELADAYVTEIMRCNLLLETGHALEAATALESMIQHHGASDLLHLKLGEARMLGGAAPEAITVLEQIATKSPLSAWSLLGRGNAKRLLGLWDEAEGFYRQALSVAPNFPQARTRLRQIDYRKARAQATMLAESGNVPAAVEVLIPELLERPDDVGICEMISSMLAVNDESNAEAVAHGHPAIEAAWKSWQLLGVVTTRVGYGHGELP